MTKLDEIRERLERYDRYEAALPDLSGDVRYLLSLIDGLGPHLPALHTACRVTEWLEGGVGYEDEVDLAATEAARLALERTKKELG